MQIEPVSSVRNLGPWFDTKLSMGVHISKVCGSKFYYLRNQRNVRKYLTRDCLLDLIHSFVTSRLDNCKSLSNFKITEIAKHCRSPCS